MERENAQTPLTPDTVDSYIKQMKKGDPLDRRLDVELRTVFHTELEEEQALQRIHQRLLIHMSNDTEERTSLSARKKTSMFERKQFMAAEVKIAEKHTKKRRLGIVATSFVAVLIAASFMLFLQIRQGNLNTAVGSPTLSSSMYLAVNNELIKMDPQMKNVEWRFTVGDSNEDFKFNISSGSVMDSNNVYLVVEKTKTLLAVNIETGKLRWKHELGAGVASDLYLVDNVLYISYYNSVLEHNAVSSILAVNVVDGKTAKKYGDHGQILGIEAGVLYAADMKNNVTAIKLADGSIMWKKQVAAEQSLNGHIQVKDSVVYLSSSVGQKISEETGLPIASYVHTLDAKTGDVIWSSPAINSNMVSDLTVDDKGVVYFGAQDNHMYALDTKAKKVLWKKPTEQGHAYAKPLLQGNVVYFAQCALNDLDTVESHLVALDAATGAKKWSTGFKNYISEAEPIQVKDGIIFVGAYAGLLGFDSESGAKVVEVSAKTLLGKEMTQTLYLEDIRVIQ